VLQLRLQGVDPAGLVAPDALLRQEPWQFIAPVSQVTKQPVSVDDGCELLSELGNGTGCTFWAAAVPSGAVATLHAMTSKTNSRPTCMASSRLDRTAPYQDRLTGVRVLSFLPSPRTNNRHRRVEGSNLGSLEPAWALAGSER
jgi:hypothetical protein